MAIDVRLNRDYYHLHQDIGNWCEKHFGPVDFFKKNKDVRWYREIMFGYQDFTFNRDEDATFFILKWIKG
jgi:hypothetical protein